MDTNAGLSPETGVITETHDSIIVTQQMTAILAVIRDVTRLPDGQRRSRQP